MQRHRDIAGAPMRTASQVAAVLETLLTATLDRSPHISRSEISTTLGAVKPAAIMLIAAGHLEQNPMVLIAGNLQLSIFTVSGDQAAAVDENLNAVPGAAEASDWVLHVPTPDPVGDSIAALLSGVPHVSTAPPDLNASVAGPAPARAASALNLDALSERMGRP